MAKGNNIHDEIKEQSKKLKDFLEDTFIKGVIEFRKGYISRNFQVVRFLAHKFKGSFSYE